jgi:aspartate kinase
MLKAFLLLIILAKRGVNMGIVVQKFGGSSVATTDKIRKIASAVTRRKAKGDSLVVVVSAMGDTTDELIELAKQVTDNPDKRELDALMSTGEMISSSLLAMTIKSMGYEAVSYTAYQIGIKTSGNHCKSLIEDIDDSKLMEAINEGKIIIVAGFQGINDEGDITTLGRGGSDTSAVALAAKLGGICEVYTDVDGIYGVDPRIYKEAHKLKEIDYEEMLELASLGAQIMHSRSVELGQKYGIPIYVGLSCSDLEGTIIREVKHMSMENKPITGIATNDDDVAITIKDLPLGITTISELFGRISARRINIDMISQTAPIKGKVNITFTIPGSEINDCMGILTKFTSKENIIIDEDITKFSVVGIGMKTTSGVAGTIFKLFSENKIEVKMITTSEIRITCAIKRQDKLKAVKIVADAFGL